MVRSKWSCFIPVALHSREEVIDRLLGVFREGGYEGASLTELSKATGLGRSSLYHYFPGGKEEMMLAVLEQVGRWMQRELVDPLKGGGTPQERLAGMITTLDQFYESGKKPCLLGALAFGAGRQIFHSQLQDAFSALIEALATLLLEVGLPAQTAHERAEDAVIRIQGSLILANGLHDPKPFQRALHRILLELLTPDSESLKSKSME